LFAPKPISETLRPDFPRLRYSIVKSLLFEDLFQRPLFYDEGIHLPDVAELDFGWEKYEGELYIALL
jgi:hypothetical protein